MEKKQIVEEMAKVLIDYTKKNHITASTAILTDYAEELYEEGYRKQSEWISVEDRLPEKNGWHISDLVIYDDPKELTDLRHTDEYIAKRRNEVTHWEYGVDEEIVAEIRRPPQSWCYITER